MKSTECQSIQSLSGRCRVDRRGAAAVLAAIAFAAPGVAVADDSLTWSGITLYGTIDQGIAYQTHGTALNDYFGPGLEYLLQKNSNRSVFSIAPNAMSQSNVGIKGIEDVGGGFSAIFKVEAQFQPYSGELADHLHAMTENNNIALSSQSSNADSARAGQDFQNAYVGVASPLFGTLTIGRQNSLGLDNILAYDPMGGSQAFALIGFSGVTAGSGATEDSRLDDAVKYRNTFGMFHVAALGQFNGSVVGTTASQGGAGLEWGGLSVDGLYSYVKNAVAAAPFTAVPAGFNSATALSGTISDNTAWEAAAKYKYGPATAYFGFEHINYANPSHPVPVGTIIIGGYILAAVNNTAYTINKVLDVVWGGAKYELTPELAVIVDYNEYMQNSYSGNGCSNISSSKCSGTEDTISFVADYTFNRHFDVYAGAMLTHVFNGLANGYLHNNTADPMIGTRVRF